MKYRDFLLEYEKKHQVYYVYIPKITKNPEITQAKSPEKAVQNIIFRKWGKGSREVTKKEGIVVSEIPASHWKKIYEVKITCLFDGKHVNIDATSDPVFSREDALENVIENAQIFVDKENFKIFVLREWQKNYRAVSILIWLKKYLPPDGNLFM